MTEILGSLFSYSQNVC